MVDMDQVNPNNERELLNASIKNMEEMLDEIDSGIVAARERQITFVKTGEINTSPYEATKTLLEDLEKEYDFYKKKLAELRKNKAEVMVLDDVSASCDLGTGKINFPQILNTANANGVKYFIVEQERFDNTTPLKAVETDAQYMKKLVFA